MDSSADRTPQRGRRFSPRVRWLIGLAIALSVLCVLLLDSEVRSFVLFKVAPEVARDAHFLRLTAGGQAVYLMGTIHGDHLTCAEYSLEHVQALVANLKPDLLLVESRPEELARGNWADGPIEMPVASLAARALGIPVAGIDWWQKSRSRPGTTSPERDDRMARNALAQLPGHRKVLILVGYSHVAELNRRLAAAGYAADRFDRGDKRDLFSLSDRSAKFPPDLEQALRKYVDQLREDLNQETDPEWRTAIERGIALRLQLLERIANTGERARLPPHS